MPQGKLDGLLQRVIDCWQQGNPPSSEMLHTADTECKLCYELLTRLMLQLDGCSSAAGWRASGACRIEVDAELRVRRKALLKQIEGLQDGDCKVVKEAIKSQQEKVAAQPPSNATEPAE